MKQTAYRSKPIGAPAQNLIGGGNALIISGLRNIAFPDFVIFIVSFLCVSCEKEIYLCPRINN